jgi:hypothetical protein
MSRDRIRKLSIAGVLVLAVAAFAYFGIVRRQSRQPAGVAQAGKDVYYCPMHKTYHSDKPGNCPICSMKLVKLEDSSAPGATNAAMKSDAANAPMNMPSGAPAGAPPPASGDNSIFVPPEKQQLIGMHSVPAEMGTLRRDAPYAHPQQGVGLYRRCLRGFCWETRSRGRASVHDLQP